tara:strand:+ start:67 stop:354 length:288 start_codon:yes stop_codon:yes gene_type:complete
MTTEKHTIPPVVEESKADGENPQPKPKKKKKRKKRCAQCNKRVGSMGIMCKCGKIFCGKHRYASEHNCTWDYQAGTHKKILEDNPDMSFAKIDTI